MLSNMHSPHMVVRRSTADEIRNNPYLSIEEKRKRLEELEIKKLECERDYYRMIARRYAKELGIETNI